jgi:hypothetical protein
MSDKKYPCSCIKDLREEIKSMQKALSNLKTDTYKILEKMKMLESR